MLGNFSKGQREALGEEGKIKDHRDLVVPHLSKVVQVHNASFDPWRTNG